MGSGRDAGRARGAEGGPTYGPIGIPVAAILDRRHIARGLVGRCQIAIAVHVEVGRDDRAGLEPARNLLDARSQCDPDASDEPHMIGVEGAETGGDEASTVVDLTAEQPRVLRWGAVTEEELASVLRDLADS